jgi:hypothetical protein
MNMLGLLHEKHKYRLMLCSHKAVEVGAVCLALMVQGNLGRITLGHLATASKTGILAIFPALGVSLTKHARHLANRWTSSIFIGACGFIADALIHESHYPGEFTEAALTAVGTFAVSIAVSYTRIGKYIDRLAEAFL